MASGIACKKGLLYHVVSISPTCFVSPNITPGCGEVPKKDAWPQGQKCCWAFRRRGTMVEVEEEEQDGRQGSAAWGVLLWCHFHLAFWKGGPPQLKMRYGDWHQVTVNFARPCCREYMDQWTMLHRFALCSIHKCNNTIYPTYLYGKFAIYMVPIYIYIYIYTIYKLLHHVYTWCWFYLNLDVHDFISDTWNAEVASCLSVFCALEEH